MTFETIEKKALNAVEIIQELKKYNFDDLYLWLSVVSIHPSNQNYGLRIDLLLGLLLSIPSEDFKGQKFGRNECCSLVNSYWELTNPYFISLEDFNPFNQLDLIPFFWEQNRYYYFYGTYERPHEYLKTFSDFYCRSGTTSKETESIRMYLKISLEFQTLLLKKIFANKESKQQSDKFYVPSESYYNSLSTCFIIQNKSKKYFKDMPPFKTGPLTNPETIMNNILTSTFYDSLFVKSKKHDYMLWPSGHIEALYRISKDIVDRIPEEEILLKSKQNKLRRICSQFFTIKAIIDGVYATEKSNMVEDFDVVSVVDGSKIILFKIVKTDDESGFLNEVNICKQKVNGICEAISKCDIIGIRYVTSPSKIYGIPSKEVELFTIFVYQRDTLADFALKIGRGDLSETDKIIELKDIEQLFNLLSGPLSFIKFIRNDNELISKVSCLSVDFLDRVIYYIDNKESYLSQGLLPNFILFQPHSWSDYYTNHLHEKYKDNIYELLNRNGLDTFNKIKSLGDNRYGCMDSAYLDCGHVVKLDGDKLIFISLPPQGFFCESFEIQTAEFITDLYSYYISKLEESLREFLKENRIILPQFSLIIVLPKSYVKRKNIGYIMNDRSLFNDEPLAIRTGKVKNESGLRTIVVYDYNKLEDLFAPSDSSGERLFVSKYLKSLLLYYCKTLSLPELEKFAKNYVEQNILKHRKGFAFESQRVSNPKLDSYRNYDKIQDVDISKLNQEVAQYLSKSNVKTGKYENEDALKLLSLIYDFLEKHIEDELAKYSKSLLLHAYQQLEYALGEEYKLLHRAGFDSTKFVEYDVVDRILEERYENHKSIIAIKFIISSILKINLRGDNIINQEKWNYIHALSSIIQTISIMYECIKYSVIPHYISINERYEFDIVSEQETVDFAKFRYAETEEKIQSRKFQVLKEKNIGSVKEKHEDNKSYYEKLEKYFLKRYGFRFNDMLTVLVALSHCGIKCNGFEPLNIVKEKEMYAYLNKEIIDCPNEKELKKIIAFLSLDFDTYKGKRFFMYHLFKSENRFNLRPIISLGQGEYCFGNQMCDTSALIWGGSVGSGNYVNDCDSELNLILESYRRLLDNQLEKDAEKKCVEILGKENVESRILNFKRLSKIFPKRPDCGEIDLLVINRKTKTINVMDVKNRIRSFRPYDIAMEVNLFLTGKKSYLAKLIKKEKFIKENIKQVLEHFNIKESEGWKTKSAFIVSQIYPMSYYKKKAVDFVILEKIQEYLVHDID
ncbi:MAG: hypothetical protein JW804_07260 [Sedimentisphaerales bacterium]|nr:hypothetical protein [Sedimentisphaerales bacterium]